MCKFLYGKGKCAHPKNFTIDCVGEDYCNFPENPDDERLVDSGGQGVTSNIEQDDKCPSTKCGIYCQKYNRFYCAGEDNCQTENEYIKHMNEDGCLE